MTLERYEFRNGELYDWKEKKTLITQKEYREKYNDILNQLRNNNRASLINITPNRGGYNKLWLKKNGYWYNLNNKLNFNEAGVLDEDLAALILREEITENYQPVISTDEDVSKYNKYYSTFYDDDEDDYRENGELFDLSRQKKPQDLKGRRVRPTKKQSKKQPPVRINFRNMI